MKKIIIPIAFLAIAFTSCKKDYTCSCETTVVSGSNSTSYSSEVTVSDVSKKYVKNQLECYSSESEFTDYVFNNETFEYDEILATRKSECEIEKK